MTESSTIQLTESYTSLLTESSQDAKSIESTIINDFTEQINTVDIPCKDNTKIKNAQGECICDNPNGYYSLKYNDILYNEQCYNIQTKPKNFFLNKETNLFEMCYKNCQTCNIYGNDYENNCSSCVSNYIFLPDNINSTNCVPKCIYYYYFSLYNIYSCTSNFQCPEEFRLLIRNKNKCIDNCSKDNIYKYQYSGECLEKCPDDTNVNGYKCEIKNTKSCSLSIFPLNLTFNDFIYNTKVLFTMLPSFNSLFLYL